MIDRPNRRQIMVQYLFGELRPEDSAVLEEAYLTDGAVFQELVSTEKDIIDRYLLDELSLPDRRRFERSFLSSPARRQAVNNAKLLLDHAAEAPAFKPSGYTEEAESHRILAAGRSRVSLLAVAVVIAILAMAAATLKLISIDRGLDKESDRIRAELSTQLGNDQVLREKIDTLKSDLTGRETPQLAQEVSPPDELHSTVSLTLGQGAERGGAEMPRLIVSSRTTSVLLRMRIETQPHPYYSVSIENADSHSVWSLSSVRGHSIGEGYQEIRVTAPSSPFETGDYVVRVGTSSRGSTDDLAGYSFHVIRR